ncbi:MAG: FecR domain-containing protein [Verrucomicrobiota bacterium]
MNDAEPDPLRDQLARLPREIEPSRDLWPGIEARLPAKPARRPRRIVWLLPLAAALVIAALVWRMPSGPSWSVATVAGAPRVGNRTVVEQARLHVGQWLETDAGSTARIQVGAIGEVQVEPNSRLRLVSAATTDHRLQLARGRMSALIWAPPRLFFVETPSATAIDLGCAYTLTVDDQGAGTLEVTAGYVSLEYGGLESIVPAGLMCLTRPGFGPGTPFANNASQELRDALALFDAGDDTAVPRIVAAAVAGDGVTLWHLLERAPAAARGAVFDRLARLHPPPAGVTRPGIVAGDAAMHDRWALDLGLWPLGAKKEKF